MKSVFSYNADINKNAYMNWRTSFRKPVESMAELAKGFMESAIELAQLCVEDNVGKRADIFIFPILFNAHHGIEVYLKSICWSLNQLLQTDKKFSPHHKLNYLLEDAIKLMEKHEGQKAVTHFLENTTAYINNLYEFLVQTSQQDGAERTADITFARYILDIKGEPQFYVIEKENVVVDLEHFIIVMEEIYNDLHGMYSYLEHKLEKYEE